MKTNDISISDLMKNIESGHTQLPDFQRGWVWDDGRIKALIASISNNYPIGAAMFLEYGNESVRFKYRPIEGAAVSDVVPQELILDGQQRLTSVYSALYSRNAVHTRTDKGDEIDRFYYIKIDKAIDSSTDRIDCIESVPPNRIVTSEIGRKIDLDLSDPKKEFENKRFPLNIILDPAATMGWQTQYFAYYNYDPAIVQEFTRFNSEIIVKMLQYTIPIITLGKDTPKEAVCQVFENVNTGGVSLTVFELVTAVFAMDDFPLREDWEKRWNDYFDTDILDAIDAPMFLTALTLLSSYKARVRVIKAGKQPPGVSCKKKDVLSLTLSDYKSYADILTNGFLDAKNLLQEERIFISRDLPYTTQLIPLSVLCTLLKESNQLNLATVKNKLKQWYWCGVFGEMYGGANETRFVNDVVGVMEWCADNASLPKTVQECYFNPLRLLTLQTRQSAAYKGIMALILKNNAQDFISGRTMVLVADFKTDSIDIHHIFPKKYCIEKGLNKDRWNSVVNKTPISYQTNRKIGGVAPSVYLNRIVKNGLVTQDDLDQHLISHWIDKDSMIVDNFDSYFISRAKHILAAIEVATGKPISGRDSDEVIAGFGGTLAD